MAINDYLIQCTQSRVLKIISLDAQTVTSGPSLTHGTLTAPALTYNGIAYCGEGGTQTSSTLHAVPFLPGPGQGQDLWIGPKAIGVSGSVDATPVVVAETLYAAGSTGYLFYVGIADPANPSINLPANILNLATGDTTRITGLLVSPVGQELILVTATGVYGADITGGTPTGSWNALQGVDVSAHPPALLGSLLLVASSDRLYAIDLSQMQSGGVLQAAWSYQFDTTISTFRAYGPTYVLAVDADGYFYVLLAGKQTSMPRAPLSLSGSQKTQVSIATNQIVATGGDGTISIMQFAIGAGSSSITITNQPNLKPASASFVNAPLVTESRAIAVDASGKIHPVSLLSDPPALGTVIDAGSALQAPINGAIAARVETPSTGQVKFLLDGANYFSVLRNLLIAAAESKLDLPPSISNTYDSRFECLIKSIANTPTTDIYIMMWSQDMVYYYQGVPSPTGALDMLKKYWGLTAGVFQRIYETSAIKGDHRLSAQTQLAFQGISNVHTYLENYPGPWPPGYWLWLPSNVSSTHQKIIIISVAGVKFALISGFNIITPSYFDTTDHTMTGPTGRYTGASWHDTGLLLQGDIVADIEAHFDRRFAKSGTAVSPRSNTYVKIANWMIGRLSCLDNAEACAPVNTPCGQAVPGKATPYDNPTLSGPAVPMDMAITENDWTDVFQKQYILALGVNLYQNLSQIRDRLVAEIALADDWIYFENFAFFDPPIVNAVLTRLQAAPSLKIVVVVPYPVKAIKDGDFAPRAPESGITGTSMYLTGKALLMLKLAAGEYSSITYDDGSGSGKIYQGAQIANLTFNLNPRDLFYSTISFSYNGAATTLEVAKITALAEVNTNPRVMFCAPVRRFPSDPNPRNPGTTLPGYPNTLRGIYVHSKLALIDERVALVGSANFNRRSMEGDEELSIFISDAATAEKIRKELFGHWKMNTVSTWWADVQAYVGGTSAAVGMVPIAYDAMPQSVHQSRWWLLSSIIDPSFFN